MRMMPFRPPTDQYDERIKDVDEKIAALVAERYAITEGNPGFPRSEYLSEWAAKYETPVRVLQHLFAILYRQPNWRERIEPEQFLRFVPVMAARQENDILVMVPYARHYNNCSVIEVALEGTDLDGGPFHHLDIQLSVNGYDVVPDRGQSSQRHAHQTFIVTPPIADDEIPRLTMVVTYESRPIHDSTEESRRHPIAPTTVRFGPQGGKTS